MPQFAPDTCAFGDLAGMGAWDISHGREHIEIVQALAARNISVPAPDLLSLLTAGQAQQAQVQSHFALHQMLRGVTGVTGVDLSQVNLSDQGDFYGWLQYHAQEHQQLRAALGIV